MITQIDINCDMGESYGRFQVGNDAAIMPYISSCNIACGFHGGDPYTLMKTLELAINSGKRIGAHPSYPDLRGFGRNHMRLPAAQLKADLMYQISALSGMTQSLGSQLSYVKPHGYLYHDASQVEEIAQCIVSAIQQLDFGIAIMGKPGSIIHHICNQAGIAFIREGFLDRRYTADGGLLSRSIEGSLLEHTDEVIPQLRSLLMDQQVSTHEGKSISLEVDSLCIHGDHPHSPQLAKEVAAFLASQHIRLSS